MKNWKNITFVGITLITILLISCKEEGGGVRLISSASLIGTWSQTDSWGETRSYEFRNDGTCTRQMMMGSKTYEYEIDWSLEGNSLTLNYEERDGDWNLTETITEEAAIIGDHLYIGVFIRTTPGETLDGTWRHSDSGVYEESGPDCREYGSGEFSLTITVTGDTFTATGREQWDEHGNCPGEEFDDVGSEETDFRGTVRLEGDEIFLTVTEDGGVAIPEEFQEESRVGYFVSENVVAWTWLDDSSPIEDFRYVKQE